MILLITAATVHCSTTTANGSSHALQIGADCEFCGLGIVIFKGNHENAPRSRFFLDPDDFDTHCQKI